ncbi:MAG: glycosyltransferase family 4 protein [Deltaproteobacteria bacterium]|nr:glycosyltransferase family 4 protein [Deltaproteobacteria bacterium]
MKILMFGWEFPPRISGGLGPACFGLTKGLSELGTNILLVLPQAKDCNPYVTHLQVIDANDYRTRAPSFKSESEHSRVQCRRVDSPLRPYITESDYSYWIEIERKRHETAGVEEQTTGLLPFSGHYGPTLMAEVRRYAEIGALLARGEQFDLIHAHDWMTFLAGVEAKKRSAKPLIVHIHATEFDRSGESVNPEIYEIERLGMEQADKVIAVSHWTRNKIIDRYGIDPAKVEVVHNGILKEPMLDRSQVGAHPRGKIVLFLGRITRQKGPEYFLEAARIVLNQVKDVRFVMAGTGDMLPRMIEQMARLRLHQHFHFTGFLQGARKERMYAMSDLFVMPSVSEPFGLTPVEALQYGVPVIVSKQSGVAEVLPHAIKVDFWDIERLAESMIHVLTNEEAAEGIVKKGQMELASIGWDFAAEQTLSVYRSLVH